MRPVKINKGKWIFTVIIVICNLAVSPGFFMPESGREGPRCGMPAMAVNLGFAIVGNIVTLSTALLYKFGDRLLKRLAP